MSIPVVYEPDVVVILVSVLDNLSELVPEGVEGLLLCDLALKQSHFAFMILLYQLSQIFFGPLVFLGECLVIVR